MTGNELKAWRIEHQIGKRMFSEVCGISESDLNQWEDQDMPIPPEIEQRTKRMAIELPIEPLRLI